MSSETAGEASLSDLAVELYSHSLAHKKIDLVVSGSIAAVESVRFVRALRRLGADVRVILSEGGAQFITPMALEWAANRKVQTAFSGTTSHLAEGDALVVAPASAHFLSAVARGESNTVERALFQSYLGQRKPVMVLPCMHQSLANSPFYQAAVSAVKDEVVWLNSREEEGKNKFPEPANLADHVSHIINRRSQTVLLTMGGTQAAIDDVRSIGNLSTGALGKEIAHELFRQGFATHVLCAAAKYVPEVYTRLRNTVSVSEMREAILKCIEQEQPVAAVFAAAVSDFEPVEKTAGKMRSDQEPPTIHLQKTEKLLSLVKANALKKVGFKLEPKLNESEVLNLWRKYQKKYNLDLMVLNQIDEVNTKNHKAYLASGENDLQIVNGKRKIALTIVSRLIEECPL